MDKDKDETESMGSKRDYRHMLRDIKNDMRETKKEDAEKRFIGEQTMMKTLEMINSTMLNINENIKALGKKEEINVTKSQSLTGMLPVMEMGDALVWNDKNINEKTCEKDDDSTSIRMNAISKVSEDKMYLYIKEENKNLHLMIIQCNNKIAIMERTIASIVGGEVGGGEEGGGEKEEVKRKSQKNQKNTKTQITNTAKSIEIEDEVQTKDLKHADVDIRERNHEARYKTDETMMPNVIKALEDNAKIKDNIREKEIKRQEETKIVNEIEINSPEDIITNCIIFRKKLNLRSGWF